MILDAARACILDFGVRRTTLTTIAKYAGISRPTLYRHYSDLNAVVTDLITREIVDLLPALGGPALTPSVGPQLVDLLAATAARLREDPLVRRIIDVDPELLAPYVFDRLGSSQVTILQTVRGLIEAGHADGSVREGEASAQAAMVLLIVQSCVQSARIVREYADEDALDRELRRALSSYLEAR